MKSPEFVYRRVAGEPGPPGGSVEMLRKIWMAGVLVALGAGCNSGNGVRGSVQRPVDAFTSVRMESGIQATVGIGQQEPLLLEGDENLLSQVQTEVVDGVLIGSIPSRSNLNPSMPFTMRVMTPGLVALSALDGSGVTGDSLQAPRLDIVSKDGSSVTLTGLTSDQVTLTAESGGTVTLAGQGKQMTADLSTGSSITTSSFTVETAAVSSVFSSGEVLVTNSISGSLEGDSRLTVFGNPADRNVTVGVGASLTFR